MLELHGVQWSSVYDDLNGWVRVGVTKSDQWVCMTVGTCVGYKAYAWTERDTSYIHTSILYTIVPLTYIFIYTSTIKRIDNQASEWTHIYIHKIPI